MNHIYRNLLWWWPKQEAHGPHRSPEIIVQIIKRMIISYSWLKKEKKIMRIDWFFIWRMLCAKFGWNWLSVDFFNFVNVFFYFVIISPWKRVGPFIWTNLNPLLPRMLCAKFGWNWLSRSGEEDLFNFVNVFTIFRNYLLLEKGGLLQLNKLEFPSPKDALCQVWM